MGKKANVCQENRAKACAYKEIGWLNRKITEIANTFIRIIEITKNRHV